MVRVLSVKAKPNWLLDVVFTDGTKCTVSMKDRLFGVVFESLRDPNLFAQAAVDEFGAICWPNGADLAPDAIYEDAVADVSRR